MRSEHMASYSGTMNILRHTFCSLLLLGLMTAVALKDWRGRRGRGATPLWWRPVAGAFAGAGLFLVLALFQLLIRGSMRRGIEWALSPLVFSVKRGQLRWSPWVPTDQLGWSHDPGAAIEIMALGIGFLIAYSAVALLFLNQWRRTWISPDDGREPERRLVAFQLLAGLAATLWLPWYLLDDLGPYLLDVLGFRGWIGYGGVTCLARPPLAVITDGLNLFSMAVLLLWLFLHLWYRAMRQDPTNGLVGKEESG